MSHSGTREPAVAGQFYEGTKHALLKQIERCFLHPLGPGALPSEAAQQPRGIIGAVCPHAGYMFSGPPAAKVYFELAKEKAPEVVIIMGAKHSWEGPDISVWPGDNWRTPLGEVNVDREVVERLTRQSKLFRQDTSAHHREHAEEVQVPFLQFIYKESMPRIVPISYGLRETQAVLASGRELAHAVEGLSVLLIASTDFTHYEPQTTAQRKDRLALDRIAALDAEGLLAVIWENEISMCGGAATAAVLEACKQLDCTRAEILGYSTSGDIIHDRSAVVGYGAAIMRK